MLDKYKSEGGGGREGGGERERGTERDSETETEIEGGAGREGGRERERDAKKLERKFPPKNKNKSITAKTAR